MTKAEMDHLAEIEYYNKMLLEAKSPKRKKDISKKIKKLMAELQEYRGYMYGG